MMLSDVCLSVAYIGPKSRTATWTASSDLFYSTVFIFSYFSFFLFWIVR